MEVLARGADMGTRMARGEMPTTLEEVGGEQEYGACYAESYIAPGGVPMHWQGGGGYGDPLLRDPAAIAHDLREDKITETGAHEVYGVVLADGEVDEDATRDRRQAAPRRAAQPGLVVEGTAQSVDLGGARQLDDNLVEAQLDGHAVVGCAHCGQVLGDARADGLLQLSRFDGPSSTAGPQVTSDPALYVDDEVVFRQFCCPGCSTAVWSSIVPAAHEDHVLQLDRLLTAAPAGS